MEDLTELRAMALVSYDSLYTSEGVNGMDDMLVHVPRKVTPEINEILCDPYCNEEVKKSPF